MALTNLTLLIMKYLWENTDDEHTVSLADISAYLEANGLKRPDPRTLRGCIEQLSESRIDIKPNVKSRTVTTSETESSTSRR